MIEINHISICADSPCSGTLTAMVAIALLVVLIAVCVLAAWRGVESRPVEHGRHRPNWS